jgi:hypothetical protein
MARATKPAVAAIARAAIAKRHGYKLVAANRSRSPRKGMDGSGCGISSPDDRTAV